MAFTEFSSKITKVENLTHDVKRFTFSTPHEFNFKAGQFMSIKCSEGEETRWRSYSVLNPPREKGFVQLCIKIIPGGFASSIFENAKVGDEFSIRGPFGHFVFDEEFEGEHIFIATGTGVTPFYSMIKEYVDKEKKMTLIFGVRKKENLFFHDEFLDISKKHPNFSYIPTLSRDDWSGKTGRVQKHIPQNIDGKIFYLCGLKEQLLETLDLLLSKGVPKEFIRKERYS